MVELFLIFVEVDGVEGVVDAVRQIPADLSFLLGNFHYVFTAI